MIKLVMTAFGGAGLLTKLISIGVLLASLGIAYGVWHHKIYQRGVDDTVAAFARADAKLVGRALEARRKLKDCQALNKTWDQSTGACR